MIAGWGTIFAVAAVFKFHSFLMGFDLGTHEQVLWNTVHGRIAASSPTFGTRSYFGVDIIVTELLLAPLYALWQRTETLLVLQALIVPLGAIPLYRLANKLLDARITGLGAAALYLLALPVQYATLYEFQIRVVGTVCFLWAFWYLEEEHFGRFLACACLALGTRSDAGFALAALGIYAALRQCSWRWVVTPLVLGLGWVALCTQILIPAARTDRTFLYTFVYQWLGDTPGAMLRTLLTRPGYVAEHVLTPEKLQYLWTLGSPLLFLFLLRPQITLIALPSLLLNLLSDQRIHWSIRYHYQAFVLPWLLIATIYAIADLRSRPATRRWWPAVFAAVVLVTLVSNVVWRSPLIPLFTAHRQEERIARAATLVAQVPPDVPVTATSKFGAHLGRRQELYYFRGNVIYSEELALRGRYWLLDRDPSQLDASDLEVLESLRRQPGWITRYEDADFVVLERTTP